MKAVDIANEWLEGKYQKMKELEVEKKAIEKELKSRMGDEKREVHRSTETVLKFVAHNTYETDAEGLNELLDSYGILAFTVKFDAKTIGEVSLRRIQPFMNPQEYYVKLNVRLLKQTFDLTNDSKIDLIKRWSNITKEFKKLSDEYKKAREEMNECKELAKTNKLPFNNGSISRIKKETTYDIQSIINEFGKEFVINNATPVVGKIQTYIDQGYLVPSEMEEFKTLTKMDIKFIMTTLEEESKLINQLNRKQSKASINRENIRKQII